MGALSFVQVLAFDTQVYSNLFSPTMQEETRKLIVKQYCSYNKISAEPCLQRLQEVSKIALPKLAAIRKLLLKNEAELPISIELPLNYHNVFVCPVNREPCSPEDKPMLLTCGHVISS